MDLAASPVASGLDREAVQRRTLRVLAAGQVVSAAALGPVMTVSAFVFEDLVGHHSSWVGIAGTATTAGSGVGAELLSRVMRRSGRRPGMALGYLTATLGALLAFAGTELAVLPVFVLGLLLYGSGIATNMLARYAATDLARPQEASRAMGRILFASTFGSIFGPLLVVPAEHAGEHLGLSRYSGPWLFAVLCFAVTGIVIWALLRPDPLHVAGARATIAAPVRLAESFAVVWASPPARLALLAMLVTQVIMVGVVGIAPLDMRAHHHEAASALMVSMHVAGMFAFAPLAGRVADRFGTLPAVTSGMLLLAISCVLSPAASSSVPMMLVAMFTLGVGWALALIGGSILLSQSVAAPYRVHVQGTADLITAFAGGAASLLYGIGIGTIGFGPAALVSALLTVPVLGWVALRPVGAIEAEPR